jgi:hypothetical protein
VAQAALAEMARTIEHRQADARDGRAILRGVGEGYIEFALEEPGWFDVAFFAMSDMLNTAAVESAGDTGRSPYQQLADALGHLVRDGLLKPAAVLFATSFVVGTVGGCIVGGIVLAWFSGWWFALPFHHLHRRDDHPVTVPVSSSSSRRQPALRAVSHARAVGSR